MPGTYDRLLENLEQLFTEMEEDHPEYFKGKKAKEIASLYALPFVIQTIRPLVIALEKAEMDMTHYDNAKRICKICKTEVVPGPSIHLGRCYFDVMIRARKYLKKKQSTK